MAEEWVSPEEIIRREMNGLRARLLSTIESARLPEGQEKALKALIKGQTFQSQSVFEEIVNTLDTQGRSFRYGPRLETR